MLKASVLSGWGLVVHCDYQVEVYFCILPLEGRIRSTLRDDKDQLKSPADQ